MELIVRKSQLRGRVAIPGSKSHTIRCVALASLAEGRSEIIAPLNSADTISALHAYRAMGVNVDTANPELWWIEGTGGKLHIPDNVIEVGNSGTTLRFAVGSAALIEDGAVVFTGDDQIRSRPVGPLLKSLNELGATAFSTRGNGKAPVVVRGPVKGGHTQIECLTSQYLSSLLVNTPLAEKDTDIEVTKLNEKPYVAITMKYLDEQGIQYQHEDMMQFTIPGGQKYKAFSKRIPADFSSATFFLVAGAALEAELVLEGLDFTDTQGDKAVVDYLKAMGADITIKNNEIVVRGNQLTGIDIDMNATPDALPAMAVAGCFARGQTRLYNVEQARLKETDRIAVMAVELGKMGADIEERPDGMIIRQSRLQPVRVNGHSDHRVVMALSIAGMALTGETVVDTAEAVNITFPDYIRLMHSVGADMDTT